jgi:GT2 family glycosyltransferase
VFSLLRQCIRDGGGLRQFLLWLRDLSAYEQRQNMSRYQRWLRNSSDQLDAKSDHSPPPGVFVIQSPSVPVNRVGKSIWSVKQLADQISTASVDFLMFGHKNAVVSSRAVVRLLEIAEETSADLVYADEDQLTERGRCAPKFKPGFSIDLLREEDYVGPIFLIRRVAVEGILARLPEEQTEISSHEMLLRLYELEARIERAGDVLVSWTARRNSRLSEQERQSVKDHLVRCYGGELDMALAEPPGLRPSSHSDVKVSIVIPTRDRIDLLATCLDSIYRIDNGPPFEIVIVNNGSTEPESIHWLREAPAKFEQLFVIDADIPFNWSKLNNIGAEAANGEVLLFLNNDIEVISEDWLDRMTVHALRPDVGVVGPLLLYPNGTIQHAGVVVGIGGFADHVYSGCPSVRDDGHVFVDPLLARNVLACTGACLMLSKEKFDRIGGFDERLAICGDLDICVRLHEEGLLNRYDPQVKLVHHESATRSRTPLPRAELEQTGSTLQRYLDEGDPFYNPSLSLDSRYPTFPAA